MKSQTLTIDHLYKYEVDDVLEGGMGRVFLMSLITDPGQISYVDGLVSHSRFIQDHFRYPYRATLAAKTIKDDSVALEFTRECNIWLSFDVDGIVPLLKVVNVHDKIFALMPRYEGNLRYLMVSKLIPPIELLKSVLRPVEGLSSQYHRLGVVHQDIKPENLLYESTEEGLSLMLSDWGIANVQASRLPKKGAELSQSAMTTMGGFGTLPYMAPERFESYISDIRADIFSLGIVIFEILTGGLPFNPYREIEEQILGGEYYNAAQRAMTDFPRRLSSLVLSMIDPVEDRRPPDYKGIVRLLRSM